MKEEESICVRAIKAPCSTIWPIFYFLYDAFYCMIITSGEKNKLKLQHSQMSAFETEVKNVE